MEKIELKPVSKYKRIILLLAFSRADVLVIAEALSQCGKEANIC